MLSDAPRVRSALSDAARALAFDLYQVGYSSWTPLREELSLKYTEQCPGLH